MQVPETMKAMVLMGHGGLDQLVYHTDWPTPKPAVGEVLIKVGACGINNTDINTRTAWYSKKVQGGITQSGGAEGFVEADANEGSWGNTAVVFPRIQGADVAGEICAVGEGVSSNRISERVMVDPWLLGHGGNQSAENAVYFGSECDGGFAEYVAVRSDNAIALSSRLTDAELATFPCAYTTAENLIARTHLRPGETVVIAGASGGVGSAAIQLCLLRGARVIGIASKAKADTLLGLGAHAVLDRQDPDLSSAIEAEAQGPIDVVLDVVGGAQFSGLINALRHGGRYSSSGAIAGPQVDFDLRQLIYKDLQLTGATICPPGTMQRVVKLIELGNLKPLLAQTFLLEQLGDAQTAFMKKQHIGNIVVSHE